MGVRDPSDGSVREKPKVELEEPAAEPRNPIFVEIEASIRGGKVKPERVSEEWAYQRAWNDALEFALRQIAKCEKAEELK